MEETGPYTGGYLLGTSTHTLLRSKSRSPFPSHCIKGIGRGRGIQREEEKNSKLVYEGGIFSQSVSVDSLFPFWFFVDRGTYQRYFSFGSETHVAGQNDHVLYRDAYGTDHDSLRGELELIAKRLDNLEQRRYFPSPVDVERAARFPAGSDANSATLAASKSDTCADTAAKSAVAAAPACQSTVDATMKLNALQKETAGKKSSAGTESTTGNMKTTPSELTTGSTSKFTTPCLATSGNDKSYYGVIASEQYPRVAMLSCVATTRVQNTNYPIMSNTWPR